MKKFLFSAVAALLAFGASAQTAKEDVRIYINPGHGSWGPNNRHCATIGHNPISSIDPDTTDFYESNTNLQKGLQVLHMLAEYGVPFDHSKNQTNENPNRIGAALDLSQNIVMSHVKCGPYPYEYKYDYIERADTDSVGNITTYIDTVMTQNPDQNNDFNRTLSVIAAEVDANNFDMFLSIHSNAHTDGSTVNYLYFCLDNKYLNSSGTAKTGQETEAANHTATSKEMSRCMWNHRILDRHTKWSHYDYTMTAADVAAGKGKIAFQNLGVLNHSVPGTLVEGYFHTYQPARHRAMNFDVCQLEGRDYARGIADYFGWEKESYGAIYGIVRDKHNKFSDAVYTPKGGTTDVYKPLNDVEVTLKDSEGNVVDTYTTDVNYNGAFVFKKVQPGNYTVEFAHPAYKADVYANTNATTEPAPLKVTVEAAVTAYPEAFLVDTAYVAPEFVYVNYPDSLAGKDGFALADEYNVKGSALNGLSEELAGKTVRRTVLREGLLYVLAVDTDKNPSLLVLDTDDNTIKANVSTVGCEGTHFNLSDIQVTADGYLLGCSKEWNQYDDSYVYATGDANHTKYGYGDVRGECWIYKWENDSTGIPTGDPVKWVSTKGTGNWYRAIVGETFAWSGTSVDGKAILSAQTATATGIRTQLITVAQDADGQIVTSESFHQPFLDGAAASTLDTSLGETYNYVTSPLDDKNYMVVSAGDAPIYECKFTHTNKENQLAKLSTDVVAANTPNVSFFKYAGKSLMVAPNIVEGKANGVKVIDITDGIENAKTIAINDATIDATEVTYAAAHGELALTIDDVSGYTTDAEIELFLVANENVTKFTTAGVKQPIRKGEYAYDLAMEGSAGEYTLTFKVTGNAPEANVILTNIDTKEETIIPIGAVVKGENTVTINADEYGSENVFNWAIEIESKPITEAVMIYNSTKSIKSNTRGGVAFVNSTESDAFGKIVVSNGYSQGIDVYSPTFELESTTAYAGSSTNAASSFRCAEHDGIVYFTDWSDAYSGIYTFNPANPATPAQWYDGTRGSGGVFTNTSGTSIGGGASGLGFLGEGEDAKMFVFCEDYPAANGQTLVQYNFGGALTWASAPDATYPNASAKLNLNTNVDVVPVERGIFAAQVRTAGNNNSSVPAFIFVDFNDNILYNAGSTGIVNGGGGSIAVSQDGTKFAASTPDEGIVIFNLTWGDDNVPAFEKVCTVPNSIASGGNNEVHKIVFDVAGNIHAFLRTNGYRAYSIPQENPVARTAAKKALKIEGTTSGVENVTIEAVDEDAPVEYYNLQGVKVENPSNGIFIKVQGKKSTKVYVK